MKYTYRNVPLNKPVWACAYHVNNNDSYHYLIKQPVLGMVVGAYISYSNPFHELKKNGEIKSKSVQCISRQYADTYEECVELYNYLIDKELQRLEEVKKHHESNKIKIAE